MKETDVNDSKTGGKSARRVSPRFSDPAQRRAVGNIVKFVAALLVLTLIARGTSGATLPRVELSSPARSEIVDAITGTASVSSRDTLDVTAPQGLTIAEMPVAVGQNVKTGDPVAYFDADEVEEKLIRETASLDKLLLDLEKLERGENTDAASLESAQRSLQRARQDYYNTKTQGEADIAVARAALEEAWAKQAEDPDAAALDTARRNLQRVQDDYETTRINGENDIISAQKTLDEALRDSADTVDSTALDTAKRNLQRAKEDYEATRRQGETDVDAANTVLLAALEKEEQKRLAWLEAEEEEKFAAEQAYRAAQNDSKKAFNDYNSAWNRASDNLTSAQRRVEDAEASLLKAENDINKSSQSASDTKKSEIERAETALETAKTRANDNLLSAARRVEDAEVSLSKAENDYLRNSEQASDSIQNEIKKAEDALASAQTRANDNLLSAARRVEDAEVSANKAGQDYNKATQQTADSAVLNSLNAVSLRLDVDKQKAIVDELEMLKKDGCIVYSDLEGVIAAVKPEGSVTGKDPIVSFVDGAKGFEASLTLDKKDSDRLAVGDECTVAAGGGSMYYRPTVTGVISVISPPDDNDRVKVTIRLPEGTWSDGQRVDVEVIKSRASYDICVPLTALHSDNSGYYVLSIEQKTTVLGVENIVVKIPVNVTASDDRNASIQGSIGRNSNIISGSNKPVSAGDRVRVST